MKLDRSMVVEAMRTSRVRRILPGLVSLLHEAGCLVVMEGIETAEHSMIAMESDVDFVQGFYFDEPRSCLSPDEDYRGVLNELFNCFQERARRQSSSERSVLTHYSKKFEDAAALLRLGGEPEQAFSEFLALGGVQRCYVLSSEGVQVGGNIGPREATRRVDPRYLPCADAEGATSSAGHISAAPSRNRWSFKSPGRTFRSPTPERASPSRSPSPRPTAFACSAPTWTGNPSQADARHSLVKYSRARRLGMKK